jgi:hypothetical protein
MRNIKNQKNRKQKWEQKSKSNQNRSIEKKSERKRSENVDVVLRGFVCVRVFFFKGPGNRKIIEGNNAHISNVTYHCGG